jgi:hypothetical protein
MRQPTIHQMREESFHRGEVKEMKRFSMQGVEWILVHRHFTCNSKNPGIIF